MEPIKLEIFINDQTRQGVNSVKGNIGDLKQYMQSVIAQLEAEMTGMQKKFQEAMSKGIDTQSDMADIQALKGAIAQLREEMKKLEETKRETSSTPVIDDERVERKMNNLKMQFSQVARELPSLAMGPQMFFLAISNNLPMLTDAIKDARKENEMLAASGKKGVPVWKQLGSALFSWNTLLMAGISLMVVYGKDFGNLISSLFKGKDAISSMTEVQGRVNQEIGEGTGNYGKQVTAIKSLADGWNKLGDSLKEKQKFIIDNKEEFEKLGVAVNNVETAENLLVKNTDKYIEAMGLRAAAAAAFKLSSEEAEKALRKQFEIDSKKNEGPTTWNKIKSAWVNASMISAGVSTVSTNAEDYHQEDIDHLEEEKTAAEDASKAYLDYYNSKMKAAKKLFEESGLTETGKGKGKEGNKKNYEAELVEARLRMQRKVERTRINVMQEGYLKRRALALQEYDEALEDIERNEKAIISKMNEARKQGDNISSSDYDKIYELSNKQRIMQQEQLNKELLILDKDFYEKSSDALVEYNKKYGSYEEKRAAIKAEYTKKILASETEGLKMSLQQEMKAAISDLDFLEFKNTIDFSEVFANLDTQTSEALEVLRGKLREYINQAAKDLSPEDLKELQDAFKKIDFEITGRNPFKELKKSLKDFSSAQAKVKEAQQDLNKVMSGGQVITGSYLDDTGKLVHTTLSQADAEKKLNDAQKNRQTTLSKLVQSANSIGQQGIQLVNSGGQIVEMLENFGVKVPEAVSETLSGIGQTMSALESIDISKPFSIVTGSIGALVGMGNTVAGLLGFGGADYSGYEKMKKKYDALIDIWDSLIDKKLEYINIDYGVEAQKAADEAAKLVEVNIQRQRDLIKRLSSSGGSAGSHSLGVRIYDRMDYSDWQRISALVGEKIEHEYQLWDLSSKQIEKLLGDEKLVSVLDTVNADFVEYLQNIVKYGEQLDDIADKEKEAVTGLGFDAFRNSYVNMLSDLDSTNEDFANQFEKHLQNAIFRSLIANKYSKDIQALYDKWADYGNDGVSSLEAEELRRMQQELTDKLLAEREQMKNDFGWHSSTSTSQSPTSGALTTMSQDNIATIEGIGRSIQTHIINTDKNVAELKESLVADSQSLVQIVENTAHLGPIRELIEKFDRDGIKVQ